MKKLILALAALGLLLILPLGRGADAAELYAPESGSATVNKTVKNLYSAGSSVNLDAPVLGDAIVAGGSVTVSQNVEQTLMAAAESIIVKGNVGQNARLAANTITIGSKIGQDLLVGANTVQLEPSAEIGGDLLAGASRLVIDGTVKGYVKGGAEEAIINGTVGGDVTLKEVNKLTIGEKAVIGGKLSYRSNSEANIASGAQIKGGIDFDQRTPYTNAWMQFLMLQVLTLATLGKLIAGFLMLLVLIYGLPRVSQNIVTGTVEKPLNKLGIGFLALVATPIAAILLLMSVVGTSIAGLLIGIYALILMLAVHYTTLVVGKITRQLLGKQKDAPLDWLTALVGMVTSTILSFIPVLGALVMFLVFFATLGSLTKALTIHRK
jgi:cytoskeletal protein CcmA (bactofilin family)